MVYKWYRNINYIDINIVNFELWLVTDLKVVTMFTS